MIVRRYTVIIGSVSFFNQKMRDLDAVGDEFNDVIMMLDASRNVGHISQRVDSLIVRNNHYHVIVESAHARLGGLIEDITSEDANIFIHNPTTILLRYIRRENEAKNCVFRLIEESRSSLTEVDDVRSKIDAIKTRIIGQNRALDEIAKTLIYLANTTHEKPYVLMLYGKSSLGKTETAKAIADIFFDKR